MKLKEAIEEVEHDMSITHIAVDAYNSIHAFEDKPVTGLDGWFAEYGRAWFVGYYTGNKKWKKTLKKVNY